MQIETRLRRLESRFAADAGACHGLDPETWRAVLQSVIHATDIIDLEREIAGLESYGHDQLPWSNGKILYRADLPRLRASCEARWREWITSRFGADVAERLLGSFERRT